MRDWWNQATEGERYVMIAVATFLALCLIVPALRWWAQYDADHGYSCTDQYGRVITCP